MRGARPGPSAGSGDVSPVPRCLARVSGEGVRAGRDVALEPDGHVHVTHHHRETGELRHVPNASGEWKIQRVSERGFGDGIDVVLSRAYREGHAIHDGTDRSGAGRRAVRTGIGSIVQREA